VLKIRTVRLRTRKVFAQSRDEVLQSSTSIGRMNYYNQQGGQSPAAAAASQQNYGEVLWRIAKAAGVAGFNFFVDENLVYHGLPYTLRAGDEQVLSRWNMLEQKLTVSRVQAVVQVLADGTALLESRGKAPTLWRACGGPWYALNRGEQAPLADGDQVSLDPYHPEAAVFTCHDERALQQGGYQQSYQQGGVGQNQRYYVQATCDYAAEQAGYLGFRGRGHRGAATGRARWLVGGSALRPGWVVPIQLLLGAVLPVTGIARQSASTVDPTRGDERLDAARVGRMHLARAAVAAAC
jgi:hypothetical protein